LERFEIQSLFAQIDCQTLLGQRDDALLRLLYNTGMRAQELVDLDANHLRFSRPYSARIYGKGRKGGNLSVTLGSTTVPSGSKTTKKSCGPLIVVGEAHQPEPLELSEAHYRSYR
jgi:site-specific recombinase XerC